MSKNLKGSQYCIRKLYQNSHFPRARHLNYFRYFIVTYKSCCKGHLPFYDFNIMKPLLGKGMHLHVTCRHPPYLFSLDLPPMERFIWWIINQISTKDHYKKYTCCLV